MKNQQLLIAQVTPYYPPHLGGMENVAKEITMRLIQKNYNVRVYTSNIGSGKKKNESNLYYLKAIELAHTPLLFTLFFKLMKLPKKSILHVHIAQAFTPEIVYLVSKIRSLPYICHVHLDVEPSGKAGFLLAYYKKYILKYILLHANKVICLSENQKIQLKKQYGLDNKKLIVIPNGVANHFFITKKKKQNLVTQLLFVGRLVSQKNVSDIILALPLMQNKVNLDIVGEGEEMTKLKTLVNRNKLSTITFHGDKRDKKLIAFYIKADIFVLPSRKEGVSLSLLEAMAAGLPIVAADSDGIRDVLQDNGILVKNPSPKTFAKALDNLIANSQQRKKLSLKASQKAKQYKWENTILKIEAVYKEVKNENR